LNQTFSSEYFHPPPLARIGGFEIESAKPDSIETQGREFSLFKENSMGPEGDFLSFHLLPDKEMMIMLI
jgi:hypothetical protein